MGKGAAADGTASSPAAAAAAAVKARWLKEWSAALDALLGGNAKFTAFTGEGGLLPSLGEILMSLRAWVTEISLPFH
eukprot:COSAG01_NODE_230_length_21075_cov_13.811603_6_plen_77_part_00